MAVACCQRCLDGEQADVGLRAHQFHLLSFEANISLKM